MKENKVDELFRKRLQGFEATPSESALENMRVKLMRRGKVLSARRWMAAAGIVLVGAGAMWLGSVLVRTEGEILPEKDMAKVLPREVQAQPGLDARTRLEENKAIEQQEHGTNPTAKTAAEPIIGKVAEVSGDRSAEVDDGVPDAPSGGTEQVAANNTPEPASSKHNTGEKETGAVLPAGVVAPIEEIDEPVVWEKAVEVKNESEKVPIRIVYKKTTADQVEPPKEKGLLKKGFKKIASAIDRLNIRNGAKTKLRKTREELVALNPVRMFKKEEN